MLWKRICEGGLEIAINSAKTRTIFADCFAQGFEVEANWYARVKQIPANPQNH
jgi:hypothetical protein